jgi:hypothetical protein
MLSANGEVQLPIWNRTAPRKKETQRFNVSRFSGELLFLDVIQKVTTQQSLCLGPHLQCQADSLK